MTAAPGRARLFALTVLLFTITPATAEERPNGWFLRLTQTDVEVATHAPSAAFHLAAGQTLHPETRASGWLAEYRGLVRIDQEGRYRFLLESAGGEAALRVWHPESHPPDPNPPAELGRATADRTGAGATAWIPLKAGAEVRVEVTYKRGARGEARLRTLWEMAPSETGGFRAEPVPSSCVCIPDEELGGVPDGGHALAGQVLLQRKGCVNCHAAPAHAGIARRPGPDLSGAAARASAAWLERWLADPAAVRPHADMPAVLGANGADAVAHDLVAYLRSVSGPYPGAAPAAAAQAQRGRELYHAIGCVACHGALESPSAVLGDPLLADAADGPPPRAPFGDLRGKWHAGALAAFLRDPSTVHRDGRMPSFDLTAAEAEQIAAYLMGALHLGGTADEGARGDPARGRAAFSERGCAQCHSIQDQALAAPAATPLADLELERGCLDAADSATPRYALTTGERDLLRQAIPAVRRASGLPAPLHAAAHAIEYLDCRACHRLDGLGGPAETDRVFFAALDDRVDLGDEGRIPPDLSGVGFKLNHDWMRRVLLEGAGARPYMATRMPRFGTDQVEFLADALARRDGVEPGSDAREPFTNDTLTQAGRRLAGRDAMNCISCHQFQDFPPAGTPGPFLDRFAERLRYEWWRSYIQAPARFKPGTRMPAFSVGRSSIITDVLDGDVYAQADALWCWFTLGEFMPAPAGLEAASELQITVADRPIVLRTFMKSAGSRAIAVGTPEGVHYAFDAGSVRLVEAWKGDFLNASGAWAGRGGTEVGGLGPGVWKAPEGPALVIGGVPEAWPRTTGRDAGLRFRGYRLDQAGYPTFLYEVGAVKVAERVAARLLPRVLLQRTFVLQGLSDGTRAVLNAGTAASRVVEVLGATVNRVERGGGAVWYEIAPVAGATEVSFALEVEP